MWLSSLLSLQVSAFAVEEQEAESEWLNPNEASAAAVVASRVIALVPQTLPLV